MSKKSKSNHASNVIRLKPVADKHLVRVVIETPKGSRNKYAYSPELRAYTLSRVLPVGMSFPYDFGFIPRTLAEDGDPVDVLLLMDEPAFPGCVVDCRLIGVIRGEQEEAGKTDRNDRIIAVTNKEDSHAKTRHIRELPERLLNDIKGFFENYHRLQGRKYRVLGVAGPEAARELMRRGMRAA